MNKLGWLFKTVFDANRERSLNTIERRMGKLSEEHGELWEAYLNVTSANNGKNKTWHDVREEAIDSVIVALDVMATRLPIDEGKTDEEIEEEIVEVVNVKMEKWKKTKTCKTDAVSEDATDAN